MLVTQRRSSHRKDYNAYYMRDKSIRKIRFDKVPVRLRLTRGHPHHGWWE